MRPAVQAQHRLGHEQAGIGRRQRLVAVQGAQEGGQPGGHRRGRAHLLLRQLLHLPRVHPGALLQQPHQSVKDGALVQDVYRRCGRRVRIRQVIRSFRLRCWLAVALHVHVAAWWRLCSTHLQAG